MRKFLTPIVAVTVIVGLAWLFGSHNGATDLIKDYVENGEIVTLKARFTPDQIMEAHHQELLPDTQHAYQEAGLKYHPYILMEVKYAQPDKKTREGMVLWSLVDGEMVLSTASWEKTHGFEDAINADASRNDFRLMNVLSKNKGMTTIEQLQKELQVEKDTLQAWLDRAAAKHLIVVKGNDVQLHFQDPKLLVLPETKVTEALVKKPYSNTQKVSVHYSPSQVKKIAKAAFGEGFTIRTTSEVYLPIYHIEVLNPDGSLLTSYWNALTGERLSGHYALRKNF